MTRSDLKTYTARLSDGKTAASYQARVSFAANGIRVARGDTGREEVWPIDSVWTSAPVRRHHLDVLLHSRTSPGTALFIEDDDFAEALLARMPHVGRKAHLWRFARPGLAVAAGVAVVAGVFWAFDLSPARALANLMPSSFREKAGESVFLAVASERKICDTTEGNAAVERLVSRLTENAGPMQRFDVDVVDWNINNAFALPGGRVVLTKGLVTNAQSPDEVAGVLAHEIGHAVHLHPETAMVRALGLTVAAKIVFAGGSDTLASAGALLLQLRYSRDAEREADEEGLRLLRAAGISPAPLGDFFERITKDTGEAGNSTLASGLELLSTHPAVAERIVAIRDQGAYEARPALEEADWKALRAICGVADLDDGAGQGKGLKSSRGKGGKN
ncbi:MAG: M48 family metalloprotease [Rhizobiales bacterium]|nr:M48 family metalloprotease [Hyphomicrobiales bacterium]